MASSPTSPALQALPASSSTTVLTSTQLRTPSEATSTTSTMSIQGSSSASPPASSHAAGTITTTGPITSVACPWDWESVSPSGRHVEYVLLAEFDIDKGSVLKLQYPRPTGVAESTLAELMVPEGAHLRETDFSVFFLKYSHLKDFPPKDEDLLPTVASSPPASAADPSSTGAPAVSSSPLTLSPPQSSTTDAAGAAFSTSPRVGGKTPAQAGTASAASEGFLCCLNVVRTMMDSTVKRGAVVKAIAVCTQHRFFHIYKPLLMLALDKYLEAPDVKILEKVYTTINSMDLSALSPLVGIDMRVLRAVRLRLDAPGAPAASSAVLRVSSKIQWSETVSIPVRVPASLEPDETGEASVSGLVSLFKEGTMTIYSALLAEKRVLFLGHNLTTRDVCNHVLSACLLISPPIFGTLRRAFPYANLTNMEFLSVKGYVAGVTNPLFEQRSQWWDVLCNVQTGEVTVAPEFQNLLNSNSYADRTAECDNQFINKVLTGVGLRYSEEWARCMFRDLTQHIVLMGQDEEQFKDVNARMYQTTAHAQRLQLLRQTHQWQRLQEYRLWQGEQSPFRKMDSVIRSHVRALQTRRLEDTEMVSVYVDLIRYVFTKAELLELLALMPESQGGLYPLAVNLFHSHTGVREGTVRLLKRLDDLKEGLNCVTSLNYFLLLTYYRLARSMSTVLDKEQEALSLPLAADQQAGGGPAFGADADDAEAAAEGDSDDGDHDGDGDDQADMDDNDAGDEKTGASAASPRVGMVNLRRSVSASSGSGSGTVSERGDRDRDGSTGAAAASSGAPSATLNMSALPASSLTIPGNLSVSGPSSAASSQPNSRPGTLRSPLPPLPPLQPQSSSAAVSATGVSASSSSSAGAASASVRFKLQGPTATEPDTTTTDEDRDSSFLDDASMGRAVSTGRGPVISTGAVSAQVNSSSGIGPLLSPAVGAGLTGPAPLSASSSASGQFEAALEQAIGLKAAGASPALIGRPINAPTAVKAGGAASDDLKHNAAVNILAGPPSTAGAAPATSTSSSSTTSTTTIHTSSSLGVVSAALSPRGRPPATYTPAKPPPHPWPPTG